MNQLLTNLQSQELHRDVKPDILAVFGDIAQGLEAKFYAYLSPVLETLQAAMNIAYNNQQTYQSDADPDDTLISYNNELRRDHHRRGRSVLPSAEWLLIKPYEAKRSISCTA
jgi:importin subunit beta-1